MDGDLLLELVGKERISTRIAEFKCVLLLTIDVSCLGFCAGGVCGMV